MTIVFLNSFSNYLVRTLAIRENDSRRHGNLQGGQIRWRVTLQVNSIQLCETASKDFLPFLGKCFILLTGSNNLVIRSLEETTPYVYMFLTYDVTRPMKTDYTTRWY